MRVLVTGGAGFIGSHLCERLLQERHQVFCVDNYYTGTKENIAGLLSDRRFKPVYHDVVFPLDLQVDEIYNLACPASPVHYQRHPIQTAKTSTAVRLGAKVLQTSTSEVYGDPLVHPQNEDYWGNVNPVGRRSCYDEGKRCAETLFFDYHRQYALDVRIVRLFNTYGPRMHPKDGRVVSNFIVQALKGGPLTIYGDGSQTRPFCYVGDLVDALLLFMKAQPATPGPLNLGNPGEFTVLELAEIVLRLLAPPLASSWSPYQKMTPSDVDLTSRGPSRFSDGSRGAA